MPKKAKAKVKTSVYPADDVQAIAEELIPELHGTLRNAAMKYVFITREDTGTEKVLPPRVQGCLRFGRVKVADKVARATEHWDFELRVNGNAWERATDAQKIGYVDWLLASCQMVEGLPKKSPADVHEVFLAVYKRRGQFTKELQDFAAAMAQQELPLEPAAVEG